MVTNRSTTAAHGLAFALVLLFAVAARPPAAAAGIDDQPEPDPAAAGAFEKVVKAYRSRPALTIKSTLKIELKQGDQVAQSSTVKAEFTFSRGGAGKIMIKDFTCTFKDGVFLAVHEGTDHSYYREEYDGSPYWTLLDAFKALPYPHIAMLWGEEAMEEIWMQLLLQSPDIVPTEAGEVVKDKRRLQRIVFTSADARVEMLLDPKTKLIQSMVHEVSGGMAVQSGATRTTTYAFEYETRDEPMTDAELAFEPGERQRVDLMAALMPPPAAAPGGPGAPGAPGLAAPGNLVGRPAPPLLLATADNDAVDLEDLRGKVVVLDFWATWCGPCRRALPLLHQVAAWTRLEDLPVEIVTVNVWEARDPNQDTPDARLASVRAFWEKNGFTLPVAMDYTDETATAYGVQGIPATFVIRSDGVVHAQPHASVDELKRTIREALDALEAPPAPLEP